MPITSTSADTAALVHAKIDVHEPGSSPGTLGAWMHDIPFQFNPKELTITKTAKWEKKSQNKSNSAGPVSYLGPEAQKMTVELYLDASRSHDESVVNQVELLLQACAPTGKSKSGGVPSAPWVTFSWGSLSGFVGYVKSVSAKYTLFTPGGRPIRAVCTVALEELPKVTGKQNPTSGGLLPRRVHIMREGDSLAMLAYREYGDPALWREVAEVNGIDDPLRVPAGRSVFLPSAGELARAETRARARTEVSRAH